MESLRSTQLRGCSILNLFLICVTKKKADYFLILNLLLFEAIVQSTEVHPARMNFPVTGVNSHKESEVEPCIPNIPALGG